MASLILRKAKSLTCFPLGSPKRTASQRFAKNFRNYHVSIAFRCSYATQFILKKRLSLSAGGAVPVNGSSRASDQ